MMRMTWNGKTTKSLGKIANGVKLIIAGVFGTIGTVDHLYTDLRFWLEGRDWDLSFGPVYGEKGTTKTIVVQPQCYFRGEKVMAIDSGAKIVEASVSSARGKKTQTAETKQLPPGYATRITQVLIGQRLQRPATGGGSLTAFFSQAALGNGVTWDVCPPSMSIALTVSFIESCTFDGTVFGRALI